MSGLPATAPTPRCIPLLSCAPNRRGGQGPATAVVDLALRAALED